MLTFFQKVAATVLALSISACGNDAVKATVHSVASSSVSTSSDKPLSRSEMARAMFDANLIDVVVEPQKGDERIIYLLGENHASVKTQVQISELVVPLFDAKLADAILIEGSNGAADFSRLQLSVEPDVHSHGPTLLTPQQAEAYWREELEWGHIAAYEYIGLVRVGTIVHGVEDMKAKARFTVKGLAPNEAELKQQQEADGRALLAFEDAIGQLRGKVDLQLEKHIDRLFTSYREAVARSQAKHRAYVVASKPTEERVELEVERVDIAGRWRALEPALTEARSIENERKEKIKAYEEKIKPFKSDIANLNGLLLAARAGDVRALARIQNLTDLVNSTESEKKHIEYLGDKLKSFEREKGGELNVLARDLKRNSERIASLEAPRVKAAEPLTRALESKRGAFFTLANALRDAGETFRLRFEKIENYFRDEAVRAKNADANQTGDLSERDAAMVQNTVRFFADRKDIRSAVLIVGSLHLEGMAKRLREAGFNVFAGKMKAAATPLEPWEEEEWRRREAAYSTFFSDVKRNPESHFFDENWVREQRQTVVSLQNIDAPGSEFSSVDVNLAWDSKIYADKGGKKAVILTGQERNPQARFGRYVVRSGPIPGQKGRHYELFDREAAKSDVKKLSGNGTAFVYFHKDIGQDGKPTYVLHAPTGDMSLEQFATTPVRAGSRSRYVVMFGEPDEVMRGKVAVSPLWERLRAAGGGGNGRGGKPPGWTAPWDEPPHGGEPPRKSRGVGAAGSGPGRSQPLILNTLNPQRARKNVELVDKQKARGPIAFLDYTSETKGLEDVRFTSPDGEHAQMVVIVARNVGEFRAEVQRAAEAGKLEGKQIALLTCGDAFESTSMLKEMMLDNGAAMVWVPDRQVTPDAARTLVDWLKRTSIPGSPDDVRASVSELIYDALGAWHEKDPTNPDLAMFRLSKGWVFLSPLDGRGFAHESAWDIIRHDTISALKNG